MKYLIIIINLMVAGYCANSSSKAQEKLNVEFHVPDSNKRTGWRIVKCMYDPSNPHYSNCGYFFPKDSCDDHKDHYCVTNFTVN